MKKAPVTIIILCLIGVAYAAVQVSLIIPDVAVPVVLDAFDTLANQHIDLEVHNPSGGEMLEGRWSYRYAPKDPNETEKQFAERVIKEHIRALVRLAKDAEERKRHDEEIAAVTPIDVNIPDDIID